MLTLTARHELTEGSAFISVPPGGRVIVEIHQPQVIEHAQATPSEPPPPSGPRAARQPLRLVEAA